MNRTPESLPLFVYGSMRDPDVAALVIGRSLHPGRVRPATLPDHRTLRMAGETYPVLARQPGERVRGALLDDLAEPDFERIRFFESVEYRLEPCEVVLELGGRERALLCGAAKEVGLTTEPWTLEEWRARHRDAFLLLTRRYMALYGRATPEEAEALWQRLRGELGL
jgi:hypothetical protein